MDQKELENKIIEIKDIVLSDHAVGKGVYRSLLLLKKIFGHTGIPDKIFKNMLEAHGLKRLDEDFEKLVKKDKGQGFNMYGEFEVNPHDDYFEYDHIPALRITLKHENRNKEEIEKIERFFKDNNPNFAFRKNKEEAMQNLHRLVEIFEENREFLINNKDRLVHDFKIILSVERQSLHEFTHTLQSHMKFDNKEYAVATWHSETEAHVVESLGYIYRDETILDKKGINEAIQSMNTRINNFTKQRGYSMYQKLFGACAGRLIGIILIVDAYLRKRGNNRGRDILDKSHRSYFLDEFIKLSKKAIHLIEDKEIVDSLESVYHWALDVNKQYTGMIRKKLEGYRKRISKGEYKIENTEDDLIADCKIVAEYINWLEVAGEEVPRKEFNDLLQAKYKRTLDSIAEKEKDIVMKETRYIDFLENMLKDKEVRLSRISKTLGWH